jgi:flagellar biosynthesis/type III secretory pathway protein FliH
MLEICVFDEIEVTDTLVGAMEVMEKIVQKILASDSDVPVTITIKRVKNNSPPTLSINVSDSSVVKDRLV